jgi:hypothetical protein
MALSSGSYYTIRAHKRMKGGKVPDSARLKRHAMKDVYNTGRRKGRRNLGKMRAAIRKSEKKIARQEKNERMSARSAASRISSAPSVVRRSARIASRK